jgi:hypothetical protein
VCRRYDVFVGVGLDLGGGQDGTLANRGLLPLNLIVVEAQSMSMLRAT